MITGKPIVMTMAMTIWIFVGKVMSLLFNMLSNFVIAYAEYIMRNATLDDLQAGIKIAERNIKTSDMPTTPSLCQKVKKN